ncbi:MAG: hypothetical protein MK102_07160 [Fuerstiella sp.]|nr:hypothetical protein [Fuerstiella sp.]
MQVSRLGFWAHMVVAGVVSLSLMPSAVGQRTRLSALERNFEEVLDDTGRRTPGLEDLRNSGFSDQPPVDLSRIDKRPLINLLKEAVAEARILYNSLRSDASRNPELQRSLREVVKIRGIASYAVEDLENGEDLNRMFPGIHKLNTDWRLLSHQLGQSPRISRKTLDIVDRIDRIERSMEEMFQLSAPMDRRALVTEFAGLEAMLENLLEELQLDPQSTDRSIELIYDTRKLGQQSRYIEDLVLDGERYEQIVREFNRFSTQWESLLRNLRGIDNRYVRRSTRRIADGNSRINDLLWLEKSTNREHLHQLANSLITSVDEFFTRTPLKLVVHLKNVDSILETAHDFYGTVQHFKQSVDNNDDDVTLLENYGYVEEYGSSFIRSFSTLRSSAGKVVLQEIESSIGSLRAELHISGTVASVDTQRLVRRAAALENLADHLKFDVIHWLERDRESYRADALKSMDRFVARCRRMHRLMQNRPNLGELRREAADLNNSWSEVYRYLTRCRTDDRKHIGALARDINALLYELESPLQQ